MIKDNLYWVLLGLAIGVLIYLADKYIFKDDHRPWKTTCSYFHN